MAAAPDRSLFTTNSQTNTLAVYPPFNGPTSSNAELLWDLPYTPDSVFADQSRVYVVGQAGGALVDPLTVFVYSNLFASAATPFGPTIAPAAGGNTGTVTVVIRGRGFQPGAQVNLAVAGQNQIGGTNTFESADNLTITTTFDLTGQTPGPRDVTISNPDGSSITLPAAFTVQSGTFPQLWLDLIGRSLLRAGEGGTYYLVFGNLGNIDAAGIAATVTVPSPLSVTTDLPFYVNQDGSTTISLAAAPISPSIVRSVGFQLSVPDNPALAHQPFQLQVSWASGPMPPIIEDSTITVTPEGVSSSVNSFEILQHVTSPSATGDVTVTASTTATSSLAPPQVTITESGGDETITNQVSFNDLPEILQEIEEGAEDLLRREKKLKRYRRKPRP